MSKQGTAVLQDAFLDALNRCHQEWDITVAEAVGVLFVVAHGIIHEGMEQQPDEDAEAIA